MGLAGLNSVTCPRFWHYECMVENTADRSDNLPVGYMVPTKQVRLTDLQARKVSGSPFAMLTAYDYSTAKAFAAAGVEVLLVGDSAANVVFGYPTTSHISMDEMCYLAAAVVRGADKAFVMVDLPFGSYEASDEQAVRSSTEILHRSGAHCVKLEGGVRIAPRIKAIKDAGIPVCAHIGFTPQSVNNLGGFKVQGRGAGSGQLIADMQAVVEAGADIVLMEMVPSDVAKRVTAECPVPTASARVRIVMARFWCGMTWSHSQRMGTAPSSPSSGATWARYSPAPLRRIRKKSKKAHSRPRNTPSTASAGQPSASPRQLAPQKNLLSQCVRQHEHQPGGAEQQQGSRQGHHGCNIRVSSPPDNSLASTLVAPPLRRHDKDGQRTQRPSYQHHGRAIQVRPSEHHRAHH